MSEVVSGGAHFVTPCAEVLILGSKIHQGAPLYGEYKYTILPIWEFFIIVRMNS